MRDDPSAPVLASGPVAGPCPTEEGLAPYAATAARSRGRRHPEPTHPYRSPFQRDRERLIHSSAFRRLMGKTQVAVAQTNDHHRTRLTHTLEVAQVSRAIARRLRLNEDLTEAIALSHDLGHPPFGHAGEEALDECLRGQGGFEHNLHALRIVEELEHPYPNFAGLNLTWEVREAMARHSPRHDRPDVRAFLAEGGPLLEAQVVDAADSLTYDTHDLDDALGLGLLTLDDLREVGFWQQAADRARQQYGDLPAGPLRTAAIRALIDWQVTDLLEESAARQERHGVRSLDDVRRAAAPLIGPGPVVAELKEELEEFLHQRVYYHARVQRMNAKGRRFLQALFVELVRQPEQLPERHARLVRERPAGPPERRAAIRDRVVADYLAGMTDRFAQQEYTRLFHPSVDV